MEATLRAHIASQSLPPPSASLLASLTARDPPPPLPALLATAKARLLTADLTASSSSSSSSSSSHAIDGSQLRSFPPDITNATAKCTPLPHDVHAQVVDLENLSLSRWQQIEQLEAVERGETTRGRQIIRVTDEQEQDQAANANANANAHSALPAAAAAAKNDTHRLVVQDGRGSRVYAVELSRVKDIAVGTTSIGCKMLLRAGTVAARGTLLLTPENCLVLGGKIDAWHDAWVRGRMARLKEAVGATT
ncbi:hypothetical protein AAL_06369 [Moelleriella libera RCEF 2490]|uniref:RecQ-mediated genome instability protein 1 n=1 Tax=Moelleriella libera RCEF 2490 TaxID=1081109 RepID=A0A167Z4L6_9HYPO|nr:hypothetical protein AAL_06369 [Moelleriella libera RCEF 2490]